MGGAGDFIFIDESGDPGPAGNPIYLLAACHMSEPVFNEVRLHIATFRYFHEVVKELKDWGALLRNKPTPQWRSLLGYLAEATEDGKITATVNWLDKNDYAGPYLAQGSSIQFRNFQLRLLLERHRARRAWQANVDIVLDRWSMNLDQRRNLEDYIRTNHRLRPVGDVTTVASAYVDSVQVVDLYARLARRVVEEQADAEQIAWCNRLMNLWQVRKGIY